MTFSYKKVSVVVPNYNYGRFIKKRIKTILEQTYPIYELIVLDDASTDGSADKLKEMVLDMKLENPKVRVRFEGNSDNSGKAMMQWKKGVEMTEGDFVWIAEADDLSSRRFLEEVMKAFDDPEVVLSYAESMIINGRGVIVAPNFRWSRDKEKVGHFKQSYVKDGSDEIREIMAIRCTIPNVSGVVFRKNAIKNKDFERAIKFSQVGDWYLYTKLLEGGKVSYNKKALNKFRIHARSKTAASKKENDHYEEVLWMHDYFRKKYELDEHVLQAMVEEEKRIEKKHNVKKGKKR